ncbi:hypothetical protein [Sporisorium scitamineum]|uniref:Uncharacterized protein n=1 Tax=Sporisorium scitamineum TaxID=49012 RepID=A0A0F7S1A0_9BASI|nr:hypothetical protein [Sporisorium scitamineum]
MHFPAPYMNNGLFPSRLQTILSTNQRTFPHVFPHARVYAVPQNLDQLHDLDVHELARHQNIQPEVSYTTYSRLLDGDATAVGHNTAGLMFSACSHARSNLSPFP